ncbi:MAG: FtsQ-type POTRA domain-containing protein [Eubacterium sp.]|nr:FtsQ-type POTRA domain-containing protein [Eubacterium sp.]
MKKNAKSKNSKQVNNPERRDSRPAGSELGAYGLEPPKIYKKNQKLAEEKATASKKQPKKKEPKTIQQQRAQQNKKRKQKMIIRKAILLLTLVVGIAAVIIVLSLTVLFKTQTITIKGNEIYSANEINAVLPVQKDKSMFLADLSGAEEKLEESLPYIYDANIKRKLPSTIVVNITETPQIYAIKNKDKTYTMVDDNFKVVEANSAKRPNKSILIKKAALLSAIPGKTAQFSDKKVKENLTQLIKAVKKVKFEKITQLYSVDINNNYLVYNSRIKIKLGSTDNLDEKLYSALAAINKLDEQNPQARGELTVGTGKQIYFTEK